MSAIADLGTAIHKAQELKPKMGDKCNHCGWCCLTEICQMGEYYGASPVIPCEFIATCGDNHYCSLVIEKIMTHKDIGIGRGCDAKTQLEQLQELQDETLSNDAPSTVR